MVAKLLRPVAVVALVLALTPRASAQLRIGAQAGTVYAPYRLIELKATGADPKAGYIWDVFPEDRADVRETPGAVILTGPPGDYLVKLRTVTVGPDGAIKIESARFPFTISGSGPTPPPPPPPPDPTDPLLAGLRAAYGADPSPTKQADARLLAAILRESAAFADDPNILTYRAVSNAVAKVSNAKVPLPRLAAVRDIVRAEFERQFGANDATTLTAQSRAALKAQLLRCAALYEEVSR